MEPVTHQQKNEAIAGFPFEGILVSENPYGSGHINDTFLLVFDLGDDEEVKVILQRMNKDVFADPEALMENIVGVTSYLRKKIEENGGDPDRETLNVIPAGDGKSYYKDSQGDYWRAYKFIHQLRQGGKAGRLLSERRGIW